MNGSKFIGYARSFQGVIVMFLTALFAGGDLIDVSSIDGFLSNLLATGTFTIGAVWSLVGTALRDKKVHIFTPKG